MSTYKVIADTVELQRFIEWLPVLETHELFYVTLLARSKYMDEEVKGWTTNSDRKQCTRFLTTADRLTENLRKLEIPLGAYQTKGVEIPQKALAAYITPNPRHLRTGMRNILLRGVEALHKGETLNMVEASMTEIHKAVSRKFIVDFDFDGEDSHPYHLLMFVNPEAVSIVQTRGGFHVLVRPELVSKEFQHTWYRNITQMPGVDATGDKMLPIPGTYQGGFVPRLSTIEGFK